MTKIEKATLKKHMKALEAAQEFFMDMEDKYEGGSDGEPTGPWGEMAEAISQFDPE